MTYGELFLRKGVIIPNCTYSWEAPIYDLSSGQGFAKQIKMPTQVFRLNKSFHQEATFVSLQRNSFLVTDPCNFKRLLDRIGQHSAALIRHVVVNAPNHAFYEDWTRPRHTRKSFEHVQAGECPESR